MLAHLENRSIHIFRAHRYRNAVLCALFFSLAKVNLHLCRLLLNEYPPLILKVTWFFCNFLDMITLYFVVYAVLCAHVFHSFPSFLFSLFLFLIFVVLNL